MAEVNSQTNSTNNVGSIPVAPAGTAQPGPKPLGAPAPAGVASNGAQTSIPTPSIPTTPATGKPVAAAPATGGQPANGGVILPNMGGAAGASGTPAMQPTAGTTAGTGTPAARQQGNGNAGKAATPPASQSANVNTKVNAPAGTGAKATANAAQPAALAKTAGTPATNVPIFQASPSGGVVATLRPGQTSFEGQIRSESNRKTGQATGNNGTAMLENGPMAEVKLQQSANTDYLAVREQPKKAEEPKKAPEPPKSVRNFKVGAEKPEKKPVNWVAWIVTIGLMLIAVFFGYIYLGQRKAEQPEPEPVVAETTVLNYWGLWEPTATFTQVLEDFSQENPGVSVVYEKQNIEDYLSRLQSALESSNGPDVFRYHASWRVGLEDKLAVMPGELMTESEFDQTFYPVAGEQLKNENGAIQGIPLMYDSLALIYNQALLDEAGLEPPKTWVEFKQAAMQLTQYGENGEIAQAGAAIGLTDNVDFSSDIIMLLALQNGMDDYNYDEENLEAALDYYTDYYNVYDEQVWDETFENSTLDFARGKVAMILGPSWLIHDILKINPTLSVGVASVPQLDLDKPIEWATYYAEGVNAKAPDQRQLAAWRLLRYMSQPEVLEKLYDEQAEDRSFGEIYPRRDMADRLAKNRYIQPYLARAESARNLPFNDRTYDKSVNDDMKAILNSVVTAKTDPNVLEVPGKVSERIRSVLAGYGYDVYVEEY